MVGAATAAMASMVVIASVVAWSALRKPTDSSTLSVDGLALSHGQERVDVDVKVHNVGQGEAGLDTDAFELWSKDKQVKLFQPTVSNLTKATVGPGSRLVGTLTFVIPEGTSPLALRHTSDSRSVLLDESSQATPEPHDAKASDHE